MEKALHKREENRENECCDDEYPSTKWVFELIDHITKKWINKKITGTESFIQISLVQNLLVFNEINREVILKAMD